MTTINRLAQAIAWKRGPPTIAHSMSELATRQVIPGGLRLFQVRLEGPGPAAAGLAELSGAPAAVREPGPGTGRRLLPLQEKSCPGVRCWGGWPRPNVSSRYRAGGKREDGADPVVDRRGWPGHPRRVGVGGHRAAGTAAVLDLGRRCAARHGGRIRAGAAADRGAGPGRLGRSGAAADGPGPTGRVAVADHRRRACAGLGPEVLSRLELLVLRAPGELRFLLATRHDLRLGLHRLRLTGELTEIRAADLRFSLAEAGALFTAAGAQLPAALARLHGRTEGWAAGLRLAALSLAGHPEPGGSPRSSRGPTGR